MSDSGSDNYWRRLDQRRLDRRRVLAGGATVLTGGIALGLVGCGSSNNNSSKATTNNAATRAAAPTSGTPGAAATKQANTGGQIGALTATVAPLAPGAGA